MALFGQREPSPYERLAEPVRRWIWDQGWDDLRDIQKRAIPVILDGGDVIISASTASGKTEAAMLPLISRYLEQQTQKQGFAIAYVGPLKALINDQFGRIEGLCERAQVPVHPWHGDVSDAGKARARATPGGIVLITPESLEATLVRRGPEAKKLFGNLQAVVIDELHAFIGTERGVHLQSLLHRLDALADRNIDRVGLSATLGDMGLAAEGLRPGAGVSVKLLTGDSGSAVLKTQLKAYRPDEDGSKAATEAAIAGHVFDKIRGKRNLVFAGSRAGVERYTGLLEDLSRQHGVEGEFQAHHGSLSREHRQDVEMRLRNPGAPVTAVCTSTLEMGIDIGDVDTVVQIGPPSSVASLRQRLGRSGRRAGQPAVLRTYIVASPATEESGLIERLQFDLVRTAAMLDLLVDGWCEPPPPSGLHLATLSHQILSLIAQHEGMKADSLFDRLCRSGPFSKVDPDLFADLLRSMGSDQAMLLEQAPDGVLLLGERGEKLVGGHEFFTVFDTGDTFRVTHKGNDLGRIARAAVAASDGSIVLAGRSWKIRSVDQNARTIDVVPGGNAARAPMFGQGERRIDGKIVAAMQGLYESADIPAFLDERAKELLAEARQAYRHSGIEHEPIVKSGNGVLVIPWAGTDELRTLASALRVHGLAARVDDSVCRVTKATYDDVIGVLEKILDDTPDPLDLMAEGKQSFAGDLESHLADDSVLRAVAEERFDVAALLRSCKQLLGRDAHW